MGKNNRELDFLFLSEVQAREERSLILLTEELKRRGYTAKYLLSGEWEDHRYPRHVKVLAVNSCFDRHALEHTVYSIVGRIDKVVALRWEQIPWNQDEQDEQDGQGDQGNQDHLCNQNGQNGQGGQDGRNKKGLFQYEATRFVKTTRTFNVFAWGRDYYDRMLACGVPKKYIHVTGPVFMDFLRPEFESVFQSKKEITKRYGIPQNCKILLFISDFCMADLPQKERDFSIQLYGAKKFGALAEFEEKTKKCILDWFAKFLAEDADGKSDKDGSKDGHNGRGGQNGKDGRNEWAIVYRKHPGVKEGHAAEELAGNSSRFYCIEELPAQQWIKVADKVVTVTSTMISELYFAKKNFVIARPFEVPGEFDCQLYDKAEHVRTYEEFKNAVCDADYSAKASSLEQYYDVGETPSYIRCADAFEKIYANKNYNSVWYKDDLDYVKKYRIHRRIKCAHILAWNGAKKNIKKGLRRLHKVYRPKSALLKTYMDKSGNVIQHDRELQKTIRKILANMDRRVQ